MNPIPLSVHRLVLAGLCLALALPAWAVEITIQVYDVETGSPLAGRCKLTDPAGNRFYPSNEPEPLPSDPPYFYMWNTFPVDLKTDVEYTLQVSRGLGWHDQQQVFKVEKDTAVVRLGMSAWYRSFDNHWLAGDFGGRFAYYDPSVAMAAQDLNLVCRVVDHTKAVEDYEILSRGVFNLPADRSYSGRDWGFPSFNVLGAVAEVVEEETPFRASSLFYMEKGKGLSGLIDSIDIEDPEMPMAAALDLIDTVRLVGPFPAEATAETSQQRLIDRFQAYYRLLDAGFRLGASAGSEATEKGLSQWDLLGAARFYCRIRGAFTYGSFMRVAEEGRSWATNGPVISMNIGRKDPGEVFRLARPGIPAKISVGAKSTRLLDRLELVHNGKVVATLPSGATENLILDTVDLVIHQPGWLAARVFEKQENPEDRVRYAHTSPMYFEIKGQPNHHRSAVQTLATQVAEAIRRVQDSQDLSAEEKEIVLGWYNRANDYYLGLIR